MDNDILAVEIHDHSLAPAQAEVWLTVHPAFRNAGTEVRGRMTGPRCLYATTIEVAYPLRQRIDVTPNPTGPFSLRAIIPEACLWDLQSPFFYQVFLELWQEGRRCAQLSFSHGLRTLRLRADGVAV